MKIIDNVLLDITSEKARTSPRLRMNHNFHSHTDAPINRLINAMEPGSYIRPHRHLNPDKEEIFLLLRGKVALFLFDKDGKITNTTIISPAEGIYGAEVEAGIWHSLLVMENNTVVYEIKEGPFQPLSPENIAPWSPEPEETPAVKQFISFLHQEVKKRF